MEEIKPKVVPIHDSHKDVTFFSEEQLKEDEEARELEETFVAKPKPREYGHDSSILNAEFTIMDDFGNKIPSMHAVTTFNEYGVNEYGQTVTQVMEEEREAKDAFDEFAKRYFQIQTDIQKLKTEQKALELEYKDLGLDVKTFKSAIQWQMKNAKKTEEEKWYEGVARQWAAGSKAVIEGIQKLEMEKEETKNVGRDKEARQQTLLDNMTKKFDKRYDNDLVTKRGHLDNQIEQAAINATYGVHRGEEEFIKLEEQKKIRDARRAAGFGDLAIHDNSLVPANHREFHNVYGEDYQKRRAEHEAKQREAEVFGNAKSQWDLGYQPIDCPLTDDFNELIKHGKQQCIRLQDCAWMWKQHLENGSPLPDEEWVTRFKDNYIDVPIAEELIKLAARAEDYWDVKRVCDEMFLSEIDPRRDEYDSPAMKIARYNRLVTTKRIPGEVVSYDPRYEKDISKKIPAGI